MNYSQAGRGKPLPKNPFAKMPKASLPAYRPLKHSSATALRALIAYTGSHEFTATHAESPAWKGTASDTGFVPEYHADEVAA